MVEPIVTIEQGQLKGKTGTDLNGGTFYSFQGIPYAKPPVGELRFKAPLPAEPWTGVRDATVEGKESVSKNMLTSQAIGSEDCLSLNVFTSQLPSGTSNAPKAVMVWIHGGAFTMGSSKSEFHGPEFLIKEDIVLVSINYRLGILGFLSLDDTTLGVPGNAGLKDMVLALKWVQKNISQFGGDPNNVTIFGESAGSVACHFLVLSPLAKGLFHRAILQSGVTLNPWVFGKRNGIEIAKVLGHESKDEKDALTFLRTVPAEKFVEAQDLLKDALRIDEDRPFCPVIENPHSEAFLAEDSLEAMLSGNYNKVPMIIGYTNQEGMIIEFINTLYYNAKQCDYRKPDYEKAIPKDYNVKKGTETFRTIVKKMEEFYYGNCKTPEDDIGAFYNLYSDTYFVHGIQNTVKSLLKSQTAPIYFYRISLDTSLNIMKKFIKLAAPGTAHGDDTCYLFKTMMTPKIDPGSPERIYIDRMTKLWANFAITGNPNPAVKDPLIDTEWPKVTPDTFNCLEIGEKLSVIQNPDAERMQFWDDIGKSLNSNS